MGLLETLGGPLGAILGPVAGAAIGAATTPDSVETTMTTQPWGPAQPYGREVMSEAQNLYGQGYPYYPGSMYNAPTPLSLAGREQYANYGMNQLPGMIGPLQQGWMGAASGGAKNPYVDELLGKMEDRAGEFFAEKINPVVTGNALNAGGYGSSRLGVAQVRGARDVARELGSAQTDFLSKVYGQNLGQQKAAWGAAPNMLNFGFIPGQTGMHVGGLYGDDQQQMLNAQMAQYQAQSMAPYQGLSFYQNMTMPYMGMGQTGTSSVPGGSPWAGALGGAQLGYGLWDAYNQSQTPPPTSVPYQTPSGMNISFNPAYA